MEIDKVTAALLLGMYSQSLKTYTYTCCVAIAGAHLFLEKMPCLPRSTDLSALTWESDVCFFVPGIGARLGAQAPISLGDSRRYHVIRFLHVVRQGRRARHETPGAYLDEL